MFSQLFVIFIACASFSTQAFSLDDVPRALDMMFIHPQESHDYISSLMTLNHTIHSKTENSMCVRKNFRESEPNGVCSFGCGQCASVCSQHGYPLFCCYITGTQYCDVNPNCPLTYCS